MRDLYRVRPVTAALVKAALARCPGKGKLSTVEPPCTGKVPPQAPRWRP
jgi:hypothetical protein